MGNQLQQILLSEGLITQDQLYIALIEHKKKDKFLGEVLIDLNFVAPDTIGEIHSKITGYSYIDLETIRIGTELTPLLSKQFCLEHGAIPFRLDKITHIAMLDPENVLVQDLIKKRVRNFLPSQNEFIFYYTHEKSFHRALQQFEQPSIHLNDSSFELVFSGLLEEAISKQASDIHFIPLEQMVQVKFRIHGELVLLQHIEWSTFDKFTVRFKILSKLDIAEKRKPQSGGCLIDLHNQPTDCRVSFHPCLWGESLVVRLLPTNKRVLSLEGLGFAEKQIQIMSSLMKKSSGLFLICGGTGSGKTTTLHAMLEASNLSTRNIMTLEQPIEYRVNGIRQTEISENGIFDFAEGVRSMMRHDPDILLIGEIRDEETAKMSVRAAMTGHLVLATLHASNPYTAPARLIDLGVQPTLLSGQILAVLGQQLIRTPLGRKAIGELVEFNEDMHNIVSQGGNSIHLRQCAIENYCIL